MDSIYQSTYHMWCVMYAMSDSSTLNKCPVVLFRGNVVSMPMC
jgi:hypothetical protein